MKKIKQLESSWLGNLNIIQMLIFLMLIYKCNITNFYQQSRHFGKLSYLKLQAADKNSAQRKIKGLIIYNNR